MIFNNPNKEMPAALDTYNVIQVTEHEYEEMKKKCLLHDNLVETIQDLLSVIDYQSGQYTKEKAKMDALHVLGLALSEKVTS